MKKYLSKTESTKKEKEGSLVMKEAKSKEVSRNSAIKKTYSSTLRESTIVIEWYPKSTYSFTKPTRGLSLTRKPVKKKFLKGK